MKKFGVVFLTFVILALTGNLYAKEKKGAELLIQKKGGQIVQGELIAVKEDALLVLESGSGADVSILLTEIRTLKISNNPSTWRDAGIGLLGGAGAGATLGLVSGSGIAALYGGVLLGGTFAILGAGTGALAGIDKNIRIEGESDYELQESLDYLRKKARIRDYN